MTPPVKHGGKKKRSPSPANRRTPARRAPVPVVGIGASAGGLEAFRALLEALPPSTGMAYVLVQHLDPRHESMLSELLARSTQISVVEVKQRTPIRADHVYVISPGKNMALESGVLTLSPRLKEPGALNMPIDHFFCSLAAAREAKAIGVVLSGTASDGTIGLRAIKEAGGLTFVQNSTAKYQGMPQSAISAGVADYVLPPHRIAEELAALIARPFFSVHESGLPEDSLNGGSEYQRILEELLKSTGVDFSHYKVTTLTRRLARRMLVNKMATPGDYLKFLRGNSKEAEALFNDILINVTGFFRDPTALQCLVRKVLPQIVGGKPEKEPFRIWVAGCSSGEEVYSLAMLILEFFGDKQGVPQLQVFGTDLSSVAIEKARRGIYTTSDVSAMSARRRERFFVKVNGSYQIRKALRDVCVFSIHNLLKDPPFSRMDIVSCCNVLIYMDTVLQRRIFSALHYALAPSGALVLGKSETVSSAPNMFVQVEKSSKVFIKKARPKENVLPAITHIGQSALRPSIKAKKGEPIIKEIGVQAEADSVLLGRFAPASVLINSDYEIVQFRGDTHAYLKHPAGKASLNLLKIVQEGLAFELREAILKARRSGISVKKRLAQLTQEQSHSVAIEVIPLKKNIEGTHFLIVFETISPLVKSGEQSRIQIRGASQSSKLLDRKIEQLEREVLQTRENARSFAEEQEAAVEELQSTNEEVLSSNEELQSINEELETSTEELESTNEELNTVNQELQTRNEELTDARDYVESILATIRNPMLVLDKELRVGTTNEAYCRTFRTTKEETEGHFLYDLGNAQWDIPELRVLLHDVLPQNNSVYDYQISRVFPDIGPKTFLLNAHALDQKGQRRLILLAFEDVTKEKEIWKQKDEFIGIASHEIKTPITTIKTFTELLQRKLSAGAKKEYANILEHLTTQSDRLTTLVTDLLSFSQLEAGKFLLNKEQFDLNKLIKRTVSALQESAPDHSISIEGRLYQHVQADASRIEQVLINLLTNAIKYSPKGKRVVVQVEERVKEAVVSVQDFGVGVEEGDHKMIFERFYRGRGIDRAETSDTSKGFGLGLYISAEIIQKHGGRMWVDSRKGKGSTFYFALPLPQKRKRSARRS